MRKTIEQALEEANKKVAMRTKYGYYEDSISSRGYKFMWSNAQARWFAYGQYADKGVHKMDANIIIIGGIGKKTADAVALMMRPLPLYGNSYEATHLR